MRFGVLLSVCVSLATTSLSNGGEFSHVRNLPALKMGATDLDGILLETNAFIAAVNGSEDSGWDIVKLTIDDQNIEIPHRRLRAASRFQMKFSGSRTLTSKPINQSRRSRLIWAIRYAVYQSAANLPIKSRHYRNCSRRIFVVTQLLPAV